MNSLPIVQASARDVDELFRCDHLGKTLALKHCVRRQLERKQSKHPRTMKLVATEEPTNGHCATGCDQGRQNRAALASAGVILGTCVRCGAGLVGADACPDCAEVDGVREVRPAPVRRTPQSTVLWSGAVPDVPICAPGVKPAPAAGLPPPPKSKAVFAIPTGPRPEPIVDDPEDLEVDDLEEADAAKDSAATAAQNPAPVAPVNHEPPAEPAQETTMEEKSCSRCQKTLRPDNTSGLCGDRAACRARTDAAAPRRKAPAEKARRPAPARPLEGKTVRELVGFRAAHLEAIAQVDAELKLRQEELAVALGEGKAA
jgi:hypothetical protein